MWAIALHLDEIRDEKLFIHSRYQKRFYKKLSQCERIRRYRRIPRCALLSPNESPWRRVYESRNDQALITMTGLDFDTFRDILQEFKVCYNKFSPFSKDGLIFELLGGETARTGRP